MSTQDTTQDTTATPRAAPTAAHAGRTTTGWLLLGGLVIAGGVALFAASAFAERGWGWGSGYGWRHGGMHDGRGDWPRGGMRGERFARFCAEDTARWQPVARLFVKTDLRLNEAQSQAFDRLADIALPGFEEVKREACNNFVQRAGAAPDRVQHLASVLRKAADATERAIEPARAFYSGLDDAQKARVDRALERGQRWQRGMMGPGMGGPGMMGPGSGPGTGPASPPRP